MRILAGSVLEILSFGMIGLLLTGVTLAPGDSFGIGRAFEKQGAVLGKVSCRGLSPNDDHHAPRMACLSKGDVMRHLREQVGKHANVIHCILIKVLY